MTDAFHESSHTPPPPPPAEDAVDRAVAQRLGRLSHMPLDTAAFDRRMRGVLPPPADRAGAGGMAWRRGLRPVAAAAAAVVIVAAVVFGLQGRAVRASATEMAQMHRDLVAGAVPTMRADTIDEANRLFAAAGDDFPALSAPPEAHTMACCMRNVGVRKVACVLLNNGGTPVTMAVADAGTVDEVHAQAVARGGETFRVQTVGELTMVMFDRQRHRVCLIGALPADRLMELAAGLKF